MHLFLFFNQKKERKKQKRYSQPPNLEAKNLFPTLPTSDTLT